MKPIQGFRLAVAFALVLTTSAAAQEPTPVEVPAEAAPTEALAAPETSAPEVPIEAVASPTPADAQATPAAGAGAEVAPPSDAQATPATDAGAEVAPPSDAQATPATDASAEIAPPADAPAAVVAAPAAVMSETMPLATTRALILDFTEADSRAIAVGERGQVLLSESRTDWRQVSNVPTRSNLNAVDAVGNLVWAVGHDGTILHSADGGETWVVQRHDPWHPPSDDMAFDPRQGMPLLDVLMLDAQNGLAVGAFSLILRTSDGGATWTETSIRGDAAAAAAAAADVAAKAVDDDSETAAGADVDWNFDDADLELEEESDPHLNAIARTGDGSLFIVAERGAGFRSRDNGQTWERLQLPYQGSMFGVLGYDGQRVLAFGMRGNAFESNDLGNTWNAIDTGTELSLMGGDVLPDGGAALVGANGVVLVRANATAPIVLHTFQTAAQETPVLSGVLAQSSTALTVSGEKGVGQFRAPAQ